FPRNVESIAADMVLEVNSRIELDRGSGGIFHIVLQRQVPIESLQMIRQAVVGSAKVITFVFYAGAKIPVSLDSKPVVIAKIVVKRIPMTEFGFLEITWEGVRRFVGKKVVRVFVGRWRGRLKFDVCRAGHSWGNCDKNQQDWGISKCIHL